MLMSSNARSRVDFPRKLTQPYSVTMYSTSMRVSVAICTRGTIPEMVPFLAADFRPMKDFPPLENDAPLTKSNCPPDPLYWCPLMNSAFTWPYRSTSIAVFTLIM